MKFRSAPKGLDFIFQGLLALSCLLAGALTTAVIASCGGSTMAAAPADMNAPIDGLAPGTPMPPIPYFPPYPPVAPQVQRAVGQLLTTPHVLPVFFTGDKLQSQLVAFIQAYITSSVSWRVLQEYGIGFGTVAAPTVLTQTLSASMSDKDIQNFLGARVQDGSLKPDAQSVVLLFLPANVVVDNNGEVSCVGFAGYHGSALLGSGAVLAYAVIPRCNMETLSGLTFAVSHELGEAATDPYLTTYNDLADPYSLWVLNLSGGEVGDLCQNLGDAAAAETGVGVVSRLWSNAAAAAFKNPCVPAPAGPSFFSIPIHNQMQTVQLNAKLRSIEQISVAAGQSTTISVRMLSPTRPSPTWNATPLEVPLPSASGGSSAPALTFTWQEAPGQATATGTDGDILHLKLTASPAGPIGYTTFRLTSVGPTAGTAKTEIDWVGIVLVTR